MKQAGRTSLILIVLVVVAAVCVVGVVVFASPSPASVANDFLKALQKHDVDKLTELSNVTGADVEKIRRQWEFTTTVATPHYRFAWLFGYAKSFGDTAAVGVRILRNADQEGAYDEPYEIPLVKTDQGWKVDVYRLHRKIYPALPRESFDPQAASK